MASSIRYSYNLLVYYMYVSFTYACNLLQMHCIFRIYGHNKSFYNIDILESYYCFHIIFLQTFIQIGNCYIYNHRRFGFIEQVFHILQYTAHDSEIRLFII